jgi:hypothetical protein
MPRFPYLSVIFLLLSALMVAVISPNAARILPPIEALRLIYRRVSPVM